MREQTVHMPRFFTAFILILNIVFLAVNITLIVVAVLINKQIKPLEMTTLQAIVSTGVSFLTIFGIASNIVGFLTGILAIKKGNADLERLVKNFTFLTIIFIILDAYLIYFLANTL